MSEIETTTLREVVVRALRCDTCRKEYIPTRDPSTRWDAVSIPVGWYRLIHVPLPDFEVYTDYCSIACLATWACNKTMEPH